MDQCRFDETQSWGVIPALAEIRVLIYRTGDEAGNLGDSLDVRAEDEGK